MYYSAYSHPATFDYIKDWAAKKNYHLLKDRLPDWWEEFIYESYEQKVPLTLIRKKNGGKADTLNMGINAAQYPYFICMDADSVLQYDSLKKIVIPVLEEENVVAVGGTVRPCNDVTLKDGRVIKYRLQKDILACMQLLEYAKHYNTSPPPAAEPLNKRNNN